MVQILERPPTFGDRLARGLGTGLSEGINKGLSALIERKQQKELGDYFTGLAKEHPGERTYELLQTVYNSPIAQDQKAAMIKALAGADPYRNDQQERLAKDSVLKRYGSRIKEIDEQLKNVYFGPEKDRLQSLKSSLQQERDQMLGFPALEAGEESFDEEEEPERPMKKSAMPKSKKQRFDLNNPKHRARRDLVLKKTKGNKEKAGLVLSKEFEL